MWRKVIAESLLTELNKRSGLQIIHEHDYIRAYKRIMDENAKVALFEAAETGDYDVSYCLEVCSALRKESENCKLILMCPDQDEEAVEQTVAAMQDGQIDDFVFYEASFDYLSSKLMTMLHN